MNIDYRQHRFLKRVVESAGMMVITANTIYVSNKSKIEFVCHKHGLYYQRSDHFYNGHHCQKCGKIKSEKFRTLGTDTFISKSKKKHGDKYDYSLSKYTNKEEKIKIICPIHGPFEQIANNHMRGAGCFECNHVAGKRDKYIEICRSRHNGRCNFYIILCYNENEIFYKVGISYFRVSIRYKDSKLMPYQYTILKVFRGDVEDIWDMEKICHAKSKEFHYKPKIKFGGSVMECFKKVYFNGVWYE